MRRIRERHPVLVGVLATIVGVAGVVAVLAAVTPRTPRVTPVSEQFRLEQGHSVMDRALGEGGRAPADKVFTDSTGTLHVTDGTGEAQYSPGLPVGVTLGFYRARGAASAYCLASRHRYLVVQSNATSTDVRGARGACPRPSLRPVHLNN